MKRSLLITMLLSFLLGSSCVNKNEEGIDVLIIGGGASGVSAGIQASRLGAKTLIVEETDWLGGMLTAAGKIKGRLIKDWSIIDEDSNSICISASWKHKKDN